MFLQCCDPFSATWKRGEEMGIMGLDDEPQNAGFSQAL